MPVSDTAANEIHIVLKTKSRDEFFIKKGLSLVKNRPEKALLSACAYDLLDNSLCGVSMEKHSASRKPRYSPWQIFGTASAVLYFFVKNLY